MRPVVKLSRRRFLAVSAGTGAGLWLGVHLPGRAEAAPAAPARFEPNAWLSIEPGGAVTIWVAKSEMGQGVLTSMPMIVAEELEVDWPRVSIRQADAEERYGRMMTGGSSSVRTSWLPLRKAGAAAREMLVGAAAARWGVDRSPCRAESGAVLHPGTGRRLAYGDLAADAAKQPVPADPALKDPKQFRIVGKPTRRLDTPPKTTGKAVFGIDVRVPGQKFAVVARPPVHGGKVATFDAKKAQAVRGVSGVYAVPSGVAVVADSTWAAMQGRDALGATFSDGPNGALDSAGIARMLREEKAEPIRVRTEGDVATAMAKASRRVEATYELPILAHATMEPMNCTADVRGDRAEIWAPTQAPQWAQGEAAKALGLPPARVVVHTTLLGGGFGRRALPDFAVEAALVSKAARVPVQVLWTREDDMRHDFYRPPSVNELRAAVDGGRLVAWHHRVRAPSIGAQIFGKQGGERPDVVESAADVPYRSPAVLVDCVVPELGIPVGWWRSVYASQNAFAEECFVDEVAAAAGADPFAFRRDHLPAGSPLRAALELAAAKAGWGTPLPAGRARGIACHSSFHSHVAEVVEVSIQKARPRVHRVVAAVHCGRVVNPDTVEAQVESAIVYGLSAALRGEITLARGRVQQGNFDEYEPLRMDEMPAIEVHVVPSADDPTGIGEPGLPPIAPAVANALFALTGKRIRRLPIGKLGA